MDNKVLSKTKKKDKGYDMNLNYKLEGRGKTLVFIHGLSDNLYYWQPLVDTLKDNYQILRYDLRGHGLSELGKEKISMDLYVEDLLSLLDNLELSQVNLIGLSLGGAIALDFTIKHPERVSSMVLMSSFYKSDKYLTNVFNSLKRSLEKSFLEFYYTILPMVLCPKVIKENQEELNVFKYIASETANVKAYIEAIDVCLNYDVEQDLEYVNVPTLIIAAKYDEITLVNMQKELHSKIKNSDIIVFNNVKHNILVGENINKTGIILKNFI